MTALAPDLYRIRYAEHEADLRDAGCDVERSDIRDIISRRAMEDALEVEPVTVQVRQPNERLLTLYALDRDFTPAERAEWERLTFDAMEPAVQADVLHRLAGGVA